VCPSTPHWAKASSCGASATITYFLAICQGLFLLDLSKGSVVCSQYVACGYSCSTLIQRPRLFQDKRLEKNLEVIGHSERRQRFHLGVEMNVEEIWYMIGCSFITTSHHNLWNHCLRYFPRGSRSEYVDGANLVKLVARTLPTRTIPSARRLQDGKNESEERSCALIPDGLQSSTLDCSVSITRKPHNPTSHQVLRQLVRRGKSSRTSRYFRNAASSCIVLRAMQGKLGITDLLAYAKTLI